MEFHSDFSDLLRAFAEADVRYMVVGGYAVAFHGRPRHTKDIDVWVDPAPENLDRVHSALTAFGAPPALLDELHSASLDDVLWMGVPPIRIDVLKGVPGGTFDAMHPRATRADWGGVAVSVIGSDDLIAIKRASGRPQDLLDIEVLITAQRE